MFVMTNDGGVAKESSSEAHAERVLLQRVFIYNLLSQGVSVTLLQGAEYRDSKVCQTFQCFLGFRRILMLRAAQVSTGYEVELLFDTVPWSYGSQIGMLLDELTK